MARIEAKNIRLFVENGCGKRLYFSDHYLAKNPKTSKQLFQELKANSLGYGIKEFEFVDLCNPNLSKLDMLCNMIIKDKLKIEWSAPAILNPEMGREIFDSMKRAGCKKLVFDLFSGSDKLLKNMGATFTAEEAARTLKICHDAGISTGTNLILAYPQESREDFDNTINFLAKNLSFIDQITNVTYCLSNYFHSNFLALPFCRYWPQCAGHDMNASRRFLIPDFKDYISRISSLGKPIVNIVPDEEVFVSLKEFENYILHSKKLTFCFDQGKGRLFWKGKELTAGLGIYTSIFTTGSWQDSEHADWQVKKLNDNKIILKGRWRLLPITQVFEIELEDEGTLKLNIEMEILEPISFVGEQQMNIMLRKEYTGWSADRDLNGAFPGSFDENWVTLYEESANKINTIKADGSKNNFPAVALNCSSHEDSSRLSALNTSSFFSARKLKYYTLDKKVYFPGRYSYFNGKIKISE